MHAEMEALKLRVEEIERRLGIQTAMCAGYCDQPTAEPGGMCQSCQEIDRYEASRLRRRAMGME